MTTMFIKYGKILSVVKNTNGVNSVYTEKISNISKVISGVENFSISLSLSKVNKTIKLIESLGFNVEIDNNYGFDFECKLNCTLIP